MVCRRFWWLLPADSHIASEATAALAKLRMSGHVKATQLAAQRAALDASADTEGDGHEAAAQESLGLQVYLWLPNYFSPKAATTTPQFSNCVVCCC